MDTLCKCGKHPRRPRQRDCRPCHAAKQRAYRARVQLERAEARAIIAQHVAQQRAGAPA